MLIAMLALAAPSLAHSPYANHRDGSWAQVDETHRGVDICDDDRDRHRTYAMIWERDNPFPVRTAYDSKGRDALGRYCLRYSAFYPVAYFSVCVQKEGCSGWTYVEGTVASPTPPTPTRSSPGASS